jgi:REP element-mobilizing transposase RayT
MGIEGRQTGWLSALHHLRLRELLLHTSTRYELLCPVYCLMPDHGHFLFGGLTSNSDQRKAVKFLRTGWNRILREESGSFELQKQAFDHVLTKRETDRKTFEKVMGYIRENPVRAGLVSDTARWRFGGSIVPGYPYLNSNEDNFGETFWKIYHAVGE